MGGYLMFTALKPNRNRVQTARTASIPAPTGGWNAVDPLSKMPALDAVILDNWIPRTGYVELRRGSEFVVQTGVPADPAESLLVWRGASYSGEELYAVAGGEVYAVVPTPDGENPVYGTLTNSRIQYVNFANDGGAWIICVNGEDTPFKYDGLAWATTTITGSSGAITLDPVNLIDVTMHKRRLFFVEKDTKHIWYLAVDAIQGDASLLDLGPIFQFGGVVTGMGTWSLDGGQGQDDYIAFLTDQGEVAIYQGTDPDDDLYWSLVGVFRIGRPVAGRRSLIKLGGDLIALTTDGAEPLSLALKENRGQAESKAITAKIQNAFQTATAAYGTLFGWEAITYETAALAIYNVPTAELEEAEQYVQNLQTGAWCRFTGLHALTWATCNSAIYFGHSIGVTQWDVGVMDASGGSASIAITCDLKTAFSYYGTRGGLKHFTMIQPLLAATSNVRPAIEMLVDFEERDPVAVPTSLISEGGGPLLIRKDWTGVTGFGTCGSVRMRIKTENDIVDGILGPTPFDAFINNVSDEDLFRATSGGQFTDFQLQVMAFNVVYQPGGIL